MNLAKLILLKYIAPQVIEEGNCIISFKVLFGKIYITEQRVIDTGFSLNKRLMDLYMSKISAE